MRESELKIKKARSKAQLLLIQFILWSNFVDCYALLYSETLNIGLLLIATFRHLEMFKTNSIVLSKAFASVD